MNIAVLGPGGVGGLIAGLLERAGTPVVVVARESTAEVISERGLRVDSVSFGEFVTHPRAVAPSGGAGGRADCRHEGVWAPGRRWSGWWRSRSWCCRC